VDDLRLRMGSGDKDWLQVYRRWEKSGQESGIPKLVGRSGNRGHSGVVVSALVVGGSTPSPCHRVVSLDKKLFPTVSLSTQVYKWVLATYCWGEPCNGLACHPGGSSNTLTYFIPQKLG